MGNEPTKRLIRSRSDRQISGVCGGVARYLNVDSTIIRVAFVLLALAGGPGLLLYIILALVMPEEA
ncbi:MAG: PspC domain-containing protein [Anaerolineae bacterium]